MKEKGEGETEVNREWDGVNNVTRGIIRTTGKREIVIIRGNYNSKDSNACIQKNEIDSS